ncbi:hypothetical protein RN001_003650 [Aquatica leii]|uniref:Uncharacterized protein n=1 Tax=Aquatica leii TaxID=1421715 RepID=A0AAN7PIP2_9COLE|nr:hypothetical protein RN001_003650 [Aquatica leii]
MILKSKFNEIHAVEDQINLFNKEEIDDNSHDVSEASTDSPDNSSTDSEKDFITEQEDVEIQQSASDLKPHEELNAYPVQPEAHSSNQIYSTDLQDFCNKEIEYVNDFNTQLFNDYIDEPEQLWRTHVHSLPVESDGAREEQVGKRAGVQGAVGLTQVGMSVSIQDIITMVVATMRETQTQQIVEPKGVSNAEIAALLPNFSGEDDEDASVWFERVETVKRAHNLSDVVTVVLLARDSFTFPRENISSKQSTEEDYDRKELPTINGIKKVVLKAKSDALTNCLAVGLNTTDEALSTIHIKPDIDDFMYQEVDDKSEFSSESDSDSPNKSPTEDYNSETDVTDII